MSDLAGDLPKPRSVDPGAWTGPEPIDRRAVAIDLAILTGMSLLFLVLMLALESWRTWVLVVWTAFGLFYLLPALVKLGRHLVRRRGRGRGL